MKGGTYTVKIEPCEEGGFWAYFPALPGCHTQGETLEEVLAMARDALAGHLECLYSHGDPIPVEKITSKRTKIEFPLSVPA